MRAKRRRVNPFKSQARMLFLIICGPLAGVGMLVVIALGDNAQLNHTQYAPDGAMLQTRIATSEERARGYCNHLRWPGVDAELDATAAAAWESYGRATCAAYPPPAGAVR